MSSKTINSKIKTYNKPNKPIVPISVLDSDDENDNSQNSKTKKKNKQTKQHKQTIVNIKTNKDGTTEKTTTTTTHIPNESNESKESKELKDDKDKDKIKDKKKKKKSHWKSHLFLFILIVVIGCIIILSIQNENAILKGALTDLQNKETTYDRKPILSTWYFSFISLGIGLSVGFLFTQLFGKKTRIEVEDKATKVIETMQNGLTPSLENLNDNENKNETIEES